MDRLRMRHSPEKRRCLMVAWKYIDKVSATIAALRDYENMRAIINNTSDEIKELHAHMASPRAANLTGMPSVRNPLSGQDKLVEQIDKMNVLNERYNTAIEYMAWFEPAWAILTDREQHILSECYTGENFRDGARLRLSGELCYTERHIDRLRAKALARLKSLLFG